MSCLRTTPCTSTTSNFGGTPYVGLVDGLVNRLKEELNEPCKVIATGGLANLFAGSSETLERVEPHLTLEGLRLLFETHKAHR